MNGMTIAQVLALVSAGQQLVIMGLATATQIRTFFKSLRPEMTDEDLNAILDGIITDATRHKALANADAGKT